MNPLVRPAGLRRVAVAAVEQFSSIEQRHWAKLASSAAGSAYLGRMLEAEHAGSTYLNAKMGVEDALASGSGDKGGRHTAATAAVVSRGKQKQKPPRTSGDDMLGAHRLREAARKTLNKEIAEVRSNQTCVLPCGCPPPHTHTLSV